MAYREPLGVALRLSLEYLDELDTAAVNPTVGLAELRARFEMALPETGMDAARVVEELSEQAAGGLLRSGSGRFFGWVIGGSVPAALAADWLTSTWDRCSDVLDWPGSGGSGRGLRRG